MSCYRGYLSSLVARDDVLKMISGNEPLDFHQLGLKPTVLYITLPDDSTALGGLQGILLTQLMHKVYDGWDGGEEISPMSWDGARRWAEQHLSTSEYDAIFGEAETDNGRSSVNLSLSNAAIEKARRAAAQAGVSLSAYIESLIQA